jgi:D-amino-acid dehydrogenase
MSKRVVIIGGGVIGLCTAYYSAQRGFKVTVLERHGPDRDSCSAGNAGMIVPSHFVPLAAPGMIALGLKWMWNPASPFYIKPRLDGEMIRWGLKFWRAANPGHVERCAPVLRDLSFASRECFEEFNRTPGVDFGLVQRGLLMLCKTQHGLDDEARFAARANALGVPAQVLDAKQTAALDPGARMDIAGSVLFPKDCHMTPDRFLAALEAECRKLGVEFVFNAAITNWKRNGPRLEAAGTTRGDFAADEFVLCGGVWTDGFARELGLRLPMQAGKGYSLTLARPRQLPQLCSILSEARCAVTPMDGALRVGGTMELAGLNEDISPVRVRGIVDSFCRYFPDFTAADFAGIQPWRGLRPCSPDGMPYLGRARSCDNLSVATGHAMMGLSLGPITGKLMAEILSGEKPAWDLSLLAPDRYHR